MVDKNYFYIPKNSPRSNKYVYQIWLLYIKLFVYTEQKNASQISRDCFIWLYGYILNIYDLVCLGFMVYQPF